jgi:hypothetical protein
MFQCCSVRKTIRNLTAEVAEIIAENRREKPEFSVSAALCAFSAVLCG